MHKMLLTNLITTMNSYTLHSYIAYYSWLLLHTKGNMSSSYSCFCYIPVARLLTRLASGMISRISIHFNITVRFIISCNSLILWLRRLGIFNGVVS